MNVKNMVFIAFLFFQCSSAEQDNVAQEALTNILTLEMTIGGDEYNEEFLLAKPKDIAVNEGNDIYILDEDRVKVFDENGLEKVVIGRPGQGPGEFERSRGIDLGISNNLIVQDNKGMNVYSADHQFIKSTRGSANSNLSSISEKTEITFSRYTKTILFTTDKGLTQYYGYTKGRGNDRKKFNILLYENGNEAKEISLSEDRTDLYIVYEGGSGGTSLPYRGAIEWEVYRDSKIVLQEPDYQKLVDITDPHYTLVFLDLETLEKRSAKYPYTPVALPDSIRNRYEKFENDNNFPDQVVESFEKMFKAFDPMVKEDYYYPPVKKFFSDAGLLFVFTNFRNENGEIFVDVFDMDKERFVRSVYFSLLPDVVKNGYAYKIVTGSEILPEVRKYKISAKVYVN